MTKKDLLILEGTGTILVALASVIDAQKARKLTLEYAAEIMRMHAQYSTRDRS